MHRSKSKKRMGMAEADRSIKNCTPPKKAKPGSNESALKIKSPAARRSLLTKSQEKPAPKPVTNEDISSNWKSFLQVKTCYFLACA